MFSETTKEPVQRSLSMNSIGTESQVGRYEGLKIEISDDLFVTIAKDVGRDGDDVTNLTLDGIAASVDLRFDLLDTDSLVTRVVE